MILILQMKTNKQTGFEEDKWLMAQKWQSLYLNMQWSDTSTEPREGLARANSYMSS